MVPFVLFVIVHCGAVCFGDYTDYTALLWLPSSENVDPADVWYDSLSTYNDVNNKTFSTLFGESSGGYRNTMLDDWNSYQPDKIRVAYWNADGFRLFYEEFNSTGSTMTDWFHKDRAFASSTSDFVFNTSFASYTASFSHEDYVWVAKRYNALVLPQYNGATYYLVRNKPGTDLLPSRMLSVTERCHMSYNGQNPFAFNYTVTNLFHSYCSQKCREAGNYPAAAVYDNYCSCLNVDVSGPTLTACTTLCDGNSAETCGGPIPFGYPADSIIFDEVLTSIDVTQFDTPLEAFESTTVNGSAEISYPSNRFIYGFNVSVPPSQNFPLTFVMMLYFRREDCSSSSLNDTLLEKTFTVPSTDIYQVQLEPLDVQCVTIHLLDITNNQSLTFPIDMVTVALQDNRFAMASILTVEAAWFIEANVTEANVTDQCECECWVHNLLYGDSPYNNLTYDEIELALKNVTDKLERELAVNKSELSSTKRSKTSAEDSRPSATAVGYTLGVALLTFSVGGIILADVPKLLGNMSMMRENVFSRFCPHKLSPSTKPLQAPPDVTITNTDNQTSEI